MVFCDFDLLLVIGYFVGNQILFSLLWEVDWVVVDVLVGLQGYKFIDYLCIVDKVVVLFVLLVFDMVVIEDFLNLICNEIWGQ